MLQRAASNAYTWWWASHIRTKQSKWLDNDIHEMEEKVKAMIKLIDEDADSFAKKAEMYFKRRPELINCVEEAFRAYKALADRYDRLSGDLHKANHQLATAFPDHVPMLEEDDDDDYSSQHENSSTDPNPPQPDASNSKHPKPPPELPRMLSSRMKKPERPTPPRKSPQNRSFSSPIDRDKAQEEIDRLQKRILALQTEKEFFKSSYEKGLAKYWDLENQMTELQDEISELQYDFSVGSLIEDDEARALMTASALKSCEDTLVSLQEQQKRSNEEADHESLRLRFARAKLRFLKGEATDTSDVSVSSSTVTDEEIIGNLNSERLDINSICEKVRLHFQMSSESSVALLAEKIDELVEKIIGLEVTVSSQTMQIQRLSTETEDLHKYLRGVEEDKKNLICDSNSLNERLTKAEIELKRLQALEKSVQDEKGVVHNHFAEACTTLNDLSEKIQSTPIEEDIEQVKEEISVKVVEEPKDVGVDENAESSKPSQAHDRSGSSPELLQILSGIEGRDKILLNEYSSIIQNFNETRQRLSDIERRNQECHSETMQQIKELRCANAIKDEEIKNLRRKLFTSESMRIKSMKKSASQQQMDKLEAVEEETPEVVPSGGTDTDPIEDQQTKLLNFDQVFSTSPLVEKFRADIDTLLEENLDFWLRFSSSYHQIQKFQTSFKELQAEAHRATEIKSQGGVRIVAPPSSGSSSSSSSSSTDTTQTERKLRELNSELQVWLEHNRLLHGELRCRFSSISSIQDEITKVTNSNEGEEVLFTPYQAAKFQGEVINMQQENNKVAKEIQAGLDHVKGLQLEVGRALSRLHQKYELSGTSKSQHQPYKHLSSTKSRVPLKTFLFGVKPKKQSIFACMNPAFHHSHSHKGDSSDHGHSKH